MNTFPYLVKVSEVSRITGVCRSKLYKDLLGTDRLPVRKIGSSTFVLSTDLENFITSLPAASIKPEVRK